MTKRFLTGFLVGLAIWFLLALVINFITTDGGYLQLTYLTEFSNKINTYLINRISSSNQELADTLSWTNGVANILNLVVYGILGGIIWPVIGKAKKGN